MTRLSSCGEKNLGSLNSVRNCRQAGSRHLGSYFLSDLCTGVTRVLTGSENANEFAIGDVNSFQAVCLDAAAVANN